MPDKSGFLHKEGKKTSKFNKRWFKLSNGILSYYKGQKDTKARGTISLISASNIKPDAARKGKDNCFEIVTAARVYCLATDTPEERTEWVKALIEEKEIVSKAKVTVADFDLLNLIGKGSFGKVMQVRKKDTGQIYAMKVLDKKHILDHNEVQHTLAEKNILQRVRHPFLVNLNWSFQTEDKLYFILDYVNGGELFFHLQREKKFEEPRVQFYAAEIELALEHLHDHGIIYRDLKPENVLLTPEGHICLTDFGLAKEGIGPEDRTITFCGTPEYLAPEVLKGKGYGKAVDWWSFGSLVYEMLTGLPPFYATDVQEMYRKILNEPLKFPEWMSKPAMDLLSRLLERDIEKRLKEGADIKKADFFKGLNFEDLYNKKIKPPYVPSVSSAASTENIDPSFTEEKPELTPTDQSQIDKADQQNFNNFTYVSESNIDKK